MSSGGTLAIHKPSNNNGNHIIPMPLMRSQEYIVIHLAMSGSVVPIRVLESDSIQSVKLRIQNFKGYPSKNQMLVSGGRELARKDSSVKDYGLQDGDIIHLVVKLFDLQTIHVKTCSGKEITIHVDRKRDVAYVKKQLANNKNKDDDIFDQDILCEGEQLEDERLIHDIAKRNNDGVIHLFVRKSANFRQTSTAKDFELTIVAPQENIDTNTNNTANKNNLSEYHDSAYKNGVGYCGFVARESVNGRDFWLEPLIVNPKATLPSVVFDLINSTYQGLGNENYPKRSSEGTGGAYLMMDATGTKFVSVFKPIDEEPMAVNNPRGLPLTVNGEGLKKGTTVGEGALREVAAYLLDHPKSGHRSFSDEYKGFSGVPPTVLARCMHRGFNHPEGVKEKVGSLQMFMDNSGSCEDMGPSAFPVEEVHKISVLDVRLANADRHAGNILVSKGEDGRFVLIPIDHGYCLPHSFEDCTFDWLYWPQSRQPFSPETVDYINTLDAEEDIALLNFYGWNLPSEIARTLRISTMLLKKGVAKGLTPFAIGNIMCRENLNKKSVIEEIVEEADDCVLTGSSEAAFMETVSEIMDRRLDQI
ncbi:phosphatidylinositol 4-kinase gamma 4-like [Rutidosis leptorrhynchoides]|uniref:phosphatidylinositol 4-kinase gamma 4-like n=1 Tax=Rutidosis leptorrhynchoides TaxID=125765 RepID=UPI003A99E37E